MTTTPTRYNFLSVVRQRVWLTVVFAAALVALAHRGVTSERKNAEASETVGADVQTIRDFVAAFNAKDVDAIMEFFTEDAVYHNMPTGPVQGTEAVRRLVSSFVGPADQIDWEILEISRSGSTVLTERIDRFVIDGKPVELPIMGAFDMRDGKIEAWRDYFDLASWQRQTSK